MTTDATLYQQRESRPLVQSAKKSSVNAIFLPVLQLDSH